MTTETECDECGGAGGWCSRCDEFADNCDCEGCDCERDAWAECGECSGTGKVEVENDGTPPNREPLTDHTGCDL